MYIKLPDTFPYPIGRFRADHRDTSFPAELTDAHYAAFGVHKVRETQKPDYDEATQGLDSKAEMIDGEWVQVWTVRDATDDEIAAYAQKKKAEEDATVRTSAKGDATIRFLISKTPAEIEAKINADVTSIATAKAIIAKLAVAVGAPARKELRGD